MEVKINMALKSESENGFFKWNETYYNGLGHIDDKNIAVVNAIDKILELLKKENSTVSVSNALEELNSVATQLFADEEYVMSKNNYPAL